MLLPVTVIQPASYQQDESKRLTYLTLRRRLVVYTFHTNRMSMLPDENVMSRITGT